MPLQLVETSEEDSFVSVAQHVSELLNEGQPRTALADTPANRFVNDCTNLVQEQRYEDYVSRMAGQVAAVYSKMPEKEAECCVSIMVHAVGRVAEERQQAAATTLANALTQSDERAEDRLSALMALYGITAQPRAQLGVLLAAAAYTAKNPTKCRSAFSSAVRGKAPRWVAEWKLTPAEGRQLNLALAAALKGSPDRATTREHLSLVSHALATPLGPQADAAPEVADAAAAALADYLRSPTVFTLDLLALPAASALAKHAKYGPLHKLVAAVVAGDVAATRAASVPAALEAAAASPASADAVLSKARMTALLVTCAGCAAGSGEVALEQLQKVLDVPADQVQSWVVRAIGSKLLEGRVDSVRGTLSVARATNPSFGPEQWARLRAQLAVLKDTVAAASAAMANVRPPPHVGARGVAAAAAAAVSRA